MIDDFKHILERVSGNMPGASGEDYLKALRRVQPDSPETASNEHTAASLARLVGAAASRQLYLSRPDWVWPFWIENQTGEHSASPLPLDLTPLLLNILGRKWSPVLNLPGESPSGFVDQRGLVTPVHGHFSMDTWVRVNGRDYFPSRIGSAQPGNAFQQCGIPEKQGIETIWEAGPVVVSLNAVSVTIEDNPGILLSATLENQQTMSVAAQLVFSIRPYTMDRIVLLHDLVYNTRGFWISENNLIAQFLKRPDASWASTFARGDVAHQLVHPDDEFAARCKAGLATAASLYKVNIEPGAKSTFQVYLPAIPLNPRFFQAATLGDPARKIVFTGLGSAEIASVSFSNRPAWGKAFRSSLGCIKGHCSYPAVWAPGNLQNESRHWKRNIGLFCNGLLDAGLADECAHLLRLVTLNQWENGFIATEPGCWDINGQFIMAVHRLSEFFPDHAAIAELYPAVYKAARWIVRKRHEISHDRRRPRGILPAGWRADDMGGLEYQCWDNFWSYAGLRAARILATQANAPNDAEFLLKHADDYRADLLNAVNRAIEFDPSGILPAFLLRHSDETTSLNDVANWPLRIKDMTVPTKSKGSRREGHSSNRIVKPWLQMIETGSLIVEGGPEDIVSRLDEISILANDAGFFPQAIETTQLAGCGLNGYDIISAALWVSLLHDVLVHTDTESRTLELFPGGAKSIMGAAIEVQAMLPTPFGKISFRCRNDAEKIILNFGFLERPVAPVRVIVRRVENGSEIDVPLYNSELVLD